MPDAPSTQAQPLTASEAAAKFAPKLPPAVQAQVDAVNAMMTGQAPGTQPGPQEPVGADPAGDDPAAAGEPAGEVETQGDPVGEDTWEQRARSMAGRLDQALNANQQLANRISELEMQASTQRLYGKGPATPATPATPPAPVNLLTEAERADYGDEFFDVVGRRAKELMMPELAAFDARMKRMEQGQQAVVEITQKTAKRGVYDVLREVVPDWQQINHHPDFHVWLSHPDPYSGMTRKDLLTDAFARHDANRVVNFFSGFLAEATGLPQNPQGGTSAAPPLPGNGQGSGQGPRTAAPPLPGNGNGSGRPTLESFAAPGRAGSGPQTVAPDKPVYTQAQIAKFADDERRGLWRGREVEAAAVWADIFRAQHEGRLQ